MNTKTSYQGTYVAYVHCFQKDGKGIGNSKRHNFIFIMAILGGEAVF
jgi:galactose-1-phosphate uridylyltransferase